MKLKFTPGVDDFGFIVTLLDEKWLINTSQYKSIFEEVKWVKECPHIITNKEVAIGDIENDQFASRCSFPPNVEFVETPMEFSNVCGYSIS